jgi:hypothetical protein
MCIAFILLTGAESPFAIAASPDARLMSSTSVHVLRSARSHSSPILMASGFMQATRKL